MSDSNAYATLPEDVRKAAVRLNALLREANEEACLAIHLLAVARGHQSDEPYVAAPGERPWHDDIVSPIWAALQGLERAGGIPIMSQPRPVVTVRTPDGT